MIKSKNRLKKTIVGMITFVLAFFFLPFQGVFAAPQEIKDDTDLSALSLYQFQLTTDNMSVVSKSSAVQQYHMDAPGYGDLQHKYPGYPMENFTLKVDKTKKEDQTFDKPLSLKFANAGTVNGKQVDAYLTINKVTLHYINNSEAPAQMADVNKKTVNFFNVSNLWGANQFEIGNIPYVDEAHDDVMKNTFTVDADITAELKYSDGSEPDMKLVMKPTDIDANGDWNTKEAFYVTNYNTSVDKRVMNNRNNLEAVQEGDKTVWNAGPGGGTSGSNAENNISGLALRSVNNTMNFGYRSANHASATFSLYVEQAQFAPEKKVEPAQIPAQAGEAVTYKTLFRIPEPGKEIIAALSSLDFVDTFDDRLDFKDLTVDANGVALTEGVDYTVEKSGQKVTVKMAAAYLNKDKAGTAIHITYNTVTNNKVGDKASGPIENIVAMKPDNLYIPSNKVTTTLLYNKIHEFESGTPGKTLPQEVKNLLPAKVSGLANGTTVNPTQPTTTKVSVPEGNWVFKGYDKDSEVVENGDVKFIGKWVLEEFTKPVKDVVDGTGTSIDGQETNANDTLTYTVTYTNTTDSARDVTITDNVPEHTTYVENSADNGGTLTGKTLTWTKNVASGETFKVTFQVKVDADVKGQRIDNTAHVDDGLAAADTNTTKNPTPTPKTGNVDVKYIDEDGNVLEGPTQVKTNAPVGEDYTTIQKTFDGYEFKSLSSDSAPANGKVKEGDSHVVYVYKKKTPTPQPKTGNVDVKYIDEDGNVLEGPTQVKTNAPVGEDYTTIQKTFDGYEFKSLSSDSAPANGKVMEGDSHVVYVYKKKTPAPQPQPKTGNVDVKYVDEDGNEVAPSEQVKTNAPVGEDYTTSPKNVAGYEFVKLSPNSASANGKVTEGDSHVIYIYKKKTPAPQPQPKTGNVDVKYVDENGNEVAPSEQVKTNAPVGEDYTTSPKNVDGYEFVKLSPNSASANGKVTEGDSHVVYVYKKKTPAPTVHPITSFVDTKGNTLIPSEDGEQPKKEIPGYRFVETKKLPNGDTEHVYEKVKTSHKDKDGNEIPNYPTEDGEQPKKDIPGYRFVETKKLPNGDTEHVYEKVKTSHKDKEGNDIPGYPTEDGEQPKKDIPGYRFVETKKLPNGDTEHVYEKVVTAPQQKPTKATKELPNTGTEDHAALAALGVLGLMSGFGLVSRKKKED